MDFPDVLPTSPLTIVARPSSAFCATRIVSALEGLVIKTRCTVVHPCELMIRMIVVEWWHDHGQW